LTKRFSQHLKGCLRIFDKLSQNWTYHGNFNKFYQTRKYSDDVGQISNKFGQLSANLSQKFWKFSDFGHVSRNYQYVLNNWDKSWMISNSEQSPYFSNIFKTTIFQTRNWKVVHKGLKGIPTNSLKFWHFRRKSMNTQKIMRMLKKLCVTNSDKVAISVKLLTIINMVWIFRANFQRCRILNSFFVFSDKFETEIFWTKS
jgi:hypothetical protein